MNEPISYGRRVSLLAAEHPEKAAIVFVPSAGSERFISWQELDRASNRVARLLATQGVDDRSMVVVGLPNCPEHLFVSLAAWKLGALVLPLRAALPAWERDPLLEVGNPTLVVAGWENLAYPALRAADLRQANGFSDESLPDRIPHPGKAIASGGSTGRPKIIVDPRPWVAIPGQNYFGRHNTGYRPGQVQLVAGPLYHNSPFGWTHSGLFDDHVLVLMEQFDAARVVDLIERHRVNFAFMTPTMMQRIIRLPGVTKRDFTSIEGIYHTASPCPLWLKQAWIDLIGAEQLYEGYGMTEGIGSVRIRGDEWLVHKGSVGRPHNTDLRILDAEGNEQPPGEIGTVFMRRTGTNGPTYRYLGAPPAATTPEGFTTVGDMG